MKKEIICICCPMGCSLEVTYDADKITGLKGNECARGKEYASKEIFHPERIVTTTVRIKGASIPVVPVKTDKPVPKDAGRRIVSEASKITINAPVKSGDIIIKNVSGTGANLVATRAAERI